MSYYAAQKPALRPTPSRLGARFGSLGEGPYLIAPTLGTIPTEVPIGEWNEWNRTIANALEPVLGAIAALPFSDADKAKLRNMPLEFLMDLCDPLENFIATGVAQTIAATNKTTRTFPLDPKQKVYDIRIDRPEDKNLNAVTRNLVRRIRTILSGMLLMSNPGDAVILGSNLLADIQKPFVDAVRNFFGGGVNDPQKMTFTDGAEKVLHPVRSHIDEPAHVLNLCGWAKVATNSNGLEIWDWEPPITNAGGTGSQGNPLGGIGGYGDNSQKVLRAFLKGGMLFSAPPGSAYDGAGAVGDGRLFQVGAINGEAYLFVQGSDGLFYKFKRPGSGIGVTPNTTATIIKYIRDWYEAQVAAINSENHMPRGTIFPPLTTTGGKVRSRLVYFPLGDTRDAKQKMTTVTIDAQGNRVSGLGHYLGIPPIAAAAAGGAQVAEDSLDLAAVSNAAGPIIGPILKSLTDAFVKQAMDAINGKTPPVKADTVPPVVLDDAGSDDSSNTMLMVGGVVAVAALAFAFSKSRR